MLLQASFESKLNLNYLYYQKDQLMINRNCLPRCLTSTQISFAVSLTEYCCSNQLGKQQLPHINYSKKVAVKYVFVKRTIFFAILKSKTKINKDKLIQTLNQPKKNLSRFLLILFHLLLSFSDLRSYQNLIKL